MPSNSDNSTLSEPHEELKSLIDEFKQLKNEKTNSKDKGLRYGKMPTFSGRPGEKVRSWIFMFEDRMVVEERKKENYGQFARSFLRENAWDLVQRMHKEHNSMPDWPELKDELIKTFQPINDDERAREQL